MNFDGTTDDALGQRVVVFKIVHRVLRVLCVSVSSVFKQTRRLRSCMTSSRAVGRCVRHRGHRDTDNAATTPRGRPDGRDLVAELQSQGYHFVNDLGSLNAAPSGAGSKLIGLFDQALSQGHMSYELDRNPNLEPSLAQ